MAALYEDKFCKLCDGVLVIKSFYFPTFKDRAQKLTDIRAIYYERQGFGLLNHKDWGEALNDIWWAKDMGRSLGVNKKHFNVVLDVGESTRKGFSVERHEQFLDAIKPTLDKQAEIFDKMPFDAAKEEDKRKLT